MLSSVIARIKRQISNQFQSIPSKGLVLVVVLTALLVLAACGRDEQVEPTPFPTAIPPTAAAAALPTPEVAAAANESPAVAATAEPAAQPDSPLPPDSPMPTPTSIAEALGLTMTASTGALTGVIFTQVTGPVQPVVKLQIGLAEVIRDEAGNPKVGGYEASTSPRVETDAGGRFSFSDLKPGVYTLIADYVAAQVQLQEDGDGDTILVEVKPNEVTNLGEMTFPKLPVPLP